MTLYCQRVKHQSFLTNAHVVQPPSAAEKNARKPADQEETRYEDITSEVTKSNVRFFAEKQVEATVGWANRQIAEIRSETEKLEGSIAMQVDMGLQPKGELIDRRKKVLQRHQDQFQSMLPVLARMPMQIG